MRPHIGITTTPDPIAGRPHETLNRAYVDAVVAAGGVPVMLPVLGPDLAEPMLGGLDGLLLSGGGDIDPATYGGSPHPTVYGVDATRDRWELHLVETALERGVPTLAICRGAQVLNVARGGTLVADLGGVTDRAHRDAERFADDVHRVAIDATSRLAGLFGATDVGVNTLHHQAVDEVGEGLRAVAWADDGTVEAIEAVADRPVLGVQWHPELLIDSIPVHRRLFEWLVAHAADLGDRRDGGGHGRPDLHVA